jgi:hypothetical protein
MRKILGVMVAAISLAAAGCGSSDDACGDGGCADSSVTPGPDGPMAWGLTRGTNDFLYKGISDITDGCSFKPAEPTTDGSMLTVTYDETTRKVTIGKPTGTPATAFFGSGVVAAATVNVATLMRENDVGTVGATCTWHEKVISIFTLIDHDKFTLTPTLTDSNFAATCLPADKPAGGAATCTSTWTWTLQKK